MKIPNFVNHEKKLMILMSIYLSAIWILLCGKSRFIQYRKHSCAESILEDVTLTAKEESLSVTLA